MATRKKATKKPAAVRRPPAKREKHPAEQRPDAEYKVGYRCPPRQYQFQPGVSGNPAGPPKARTNLWPTLCRMMTLDDKQLRALQKRRKELKLVEIIAIKLAIQLRDGVPRRGIPLIIKHMIERDEGKPIQSIRLQEEDPLSHEECEAIREELRVASLGARQPSPHPIEPQDRDSESSEDPGRRFPVGTSNKPHRQEIGRRPPHGATPAQRSGVIRPDVRGP